MIFMNIEERFKENISLANHTTFRIGGPAKYFFETNSAQEIKDAIFWAKENSVSYFILGGGSNLLVNDDGFGGLIIKVKSSMFKVKSQNQELKIITDAGVPLIKIILETVKQGYSGAEWGFGIPGTVGGAICGNAGRLGQDISQVVESVTMLDKYLKEKKLSRKDCEFSYRESIFKKNDGIILDATLVFLKKEQSQIEEILNQAKKVIREHPPFPSAGSAFKNYEIKNRDDALLKNHPELKSRVRGGKIGVGFLIDQCGLKGKQIKGAKIWKGHANYIVNVGGAKASDIIELINLCKKSVKEKFGIKLEEEIRYLGF